MLKIYSRPNLGVEEVYSTPAKQRTTIAKNCLLLSKCLHFDEKLFHKESSPFSLSQSFSPSSTSNLVLNFLLQPLSGYELPLLFLFHIHTFHGSPVYGSILPDLVSIFCSTLMPHTLSSASHLQTYSTYIRVDPSDTAVVSR
jgi:hypothetical protein